MAPLQSDQDRNGDRPAPTSSARDERRAAALRANLQRRKAQARGRADVARDSAGVAPGGADVAPDGADQK